MDYGFINTYYNIYYITLILIIDKRQNPEKPVPREALLYYAFKDTYRCFNI